MPEDIITEKETEVAQFTDEETATSTIENPDTESVEVLKEEILALRQQISELEETKRAQERMIEEISDLYTLFPEADLEKIPESVWTSVKNGCNLPAAYALYQKRAEAEAERIAKINTENASRSPGIAGKNTAGEYFSPEEVRKMSRAEVHANYSKIKESMKKWM